MKTFNAISALFAALAATVAALTPPVGDPTGNPIVRPGLHEAVPVDEPYEIKWDVTLHPESTVSLVLLKGPSTNVVPVGVIVEATANDGSFIFTPSTTFPELVLHDSTEGWGIQLIVDTTGQYQYSTQFGFLNPGVSEGDSKPTLTGSATATETTSLAVSSTAVISNTTVPVTSTTEIETTTTSLPVNATTTKVTKTSTTTEIETTSAAEEETTSATTLITSTASSTPSSNATTTSSRPPVQSDSGVGRIAVSWGMGAVTMLVAGFYLL